MDEYFFNLPLITDLTTDQQAVLNEPRAIAVSGGPGTGKTVITLWRHIRNHDTGLRRSLLLTYTKSLEFYLASSARTENKSASEHVNRIYHWTTHESNRDYDEIIVDEAQDVSINTYYKLRSLTSMVSFSADNNQRLYEHGTNEQDLRNLFPNPYFRLQKNFRNSKQISKFVKSMFPNYLIQTGETDSMKPQLICSDGNPNVQTEIILDIIETYADVGHNVAVLLPLQNHTSYWYDLIRNQGHGCSKFSNQDEEITRISNIHVTTFKSSKGLEFDTVIIPFFNQFKYFIANLNVVEKNDYYVIFTRAKKNLFLIDHRRTVNQKTNLEFLSLPLSRDLIEVDYSYLPNLPTEVIAPEFDDEEDDLPF